MARPRNPASPYGVESRLVSFRVPAHVYEWLAARSESPAALARTLFLDRLAQVDKPAKPTRKPKPPR